ncbi:hypothetical protein [Catenuloplanes indicus]|uniref:Uncharacterized protein n=1 Tax=Catenuloplanes indicus TaxID=137267 RepID=A0AAE3VU04_9ACTN|nr:hypothetical protein [Catenuloplanes indicus]MDQ0363686.1 hypothetical protein [Catenuloplanes indicus]
MNEREHPAAERAWSGATGTPDGDDSGWIAFDGPLKSLPWGRNTCTVTGLRLLATHGDVTDIPVLVAGLDRLDARPDDRCGYDELVSGLARIGGPPAATTLPRLWFSPHSYERASYLRALATLDLAGAQRKIIEGLWDCEADVRLLAVQRTPLDDRIRQRLQYLRDDPIETAEVRAAAMDRLVRHPVDRTVPELDHRTLPVGWARRPARNVPGDAPSVRARHFRTEFPAAVSMIPSGPGRTPV